MSGEGKIWRMSRIERVFWMILLLLVMGTIFWLSSHNSQKSEDISDSVAGILQVEQTESSVRVSNQPLFLGLTLRKIAHIFLFFCLGGCMAEVLNGWKFRIPGTLLLCYLYAVTDEWHQSLSGRYGRWEDTLIDLIGIVLGLCAALLYDWLRKRRKERKGKKAA